MIINHTHRFIFVHVPKAAGTSIVSAMAKYSTYQDLEIGGSPLGEAIAPFMNNRFNLRKHSTAADIISVVGSPTFQSYFSFCIVRNPFDRLQSTYHFLKGWKNYSPEFASKFEKFDSFSEFLDSNLWATKAGPDNIFKPQTYWVNDPRSGLPLVRYPVKLERLETAVSTLSQALFNVDNAITIGKKNRSDPYEKFAGWSDENVSMIRDVYASDFAQFGYSSDPNES